jgi:glycosyltransferase involved in cell wall biosynthesis
MAETTMTRQMADFIRPPVLLVAPETPPYGGVALQGQLLRERLAQDGVRYLFLASNLPFAGPLRFLDRIRGVRPFLRSALYSWRLWKMLAEVKVLHILACSWLYFFLVVCPAVILGRIRGKRVVLTYHGGEADQFLRRFGSVLAPVFRMADVVTAPSTFLVEVIRRRIGVAVEIVPNLVDCGTFRFRPRTPLRPKMLVTRHLEKLYDIECVIRAFSAVQNRYPDASLLIAGTGSEEDRLRKLVAAGNVKNVEFLGYVPFRDLPALYDQCDILLNASRADNFPGSLVEAAAAGLAVVSTAAGGIPHIFENGSSALLAEVGDCAGLAAAVLRVLEDPDLASALITTARRQCRRYEWNSVRGLLFRSYGYEEHPRELPATATAVRE